MPGAGATARAAWRNAASRALAGRTETRAPFFTDTEHYSLAAVELFHPDAPSNSFPSSERRASRNAAAFHDWRGMPRGLPLSP